MSLIQWTDALSVNVGEIDRQHRKLVGLMNDLSDAMSQKKGKEAMERTLKGLLEYTVTHFSHEEKLFDRFNYPAAVSHKQAHASFVKKVGEFLDGYEKGRLGLSIEIMYFLRDWLKDHIQGIDRQYSSFFNAKGLK
ncbi:MAG TPA: bacteriohemerythrin [Deltaproteobacteria bacterium]|jgi:hemerythrin|nr:bacteriohemerythrin [Deltaproteobacteria bacterium]HOI05651.1 bacteriohemerythrin [Deltaproteobacteria bacterium]